MSGGSTGHATWAYRFLLTVYTSEIRAGQGTVKVTSPP